MPSPVGFVYILTNNAMTVFKVGCTERSPRARADELSQATGVPEEFDVACYIEIRDFQVVERRIHAALASSRVSPNREFFYDSSLNYAVSILYFRPDKLSFAEGETLRASLGFFGADADVPLAQLLSWKRRDAATAPVSGASDQPSVDGKRIEKAA